MRKLVTLFLFALAFTAQGSAQVVYTKTQVAGTASATMTITKTATVNTFTATIVVTGSFGSYGNFQGPFWVNGPTFYCENVGTYNYTLVTSTAQTTGYFGGQQKSGGPYTASNVAIIIPLWSPPSKSDQTITVSPTSATLTKNDNFDFVVSGGNTSLVFNMDGVAPRLGAGAGAWTRKFDATGVYTFTIYAEEDATYKKSNTVSVSVTVKGYSIKVKLPANPTAYIVNYEVSQGGVYLFTTVQLAGALEETRTFEVPKNLPVTVTPVVMGLSKDGVLWVDTPGASTTLTPSIITPQPTITGDEDLTPSGVSTPAIPSKPEVEEAAKSVWKPTAPGAVAATDDTLKTATDKITASVDKLNATIKGGLQVTVTNTGSTDGPNSDVGTHTRLDTANAHLDKIEKALSPGDAPPTTLDQANGQASSRQTWAAAGGKSVTGNPTATGISAAPGVMATMHVGDRDVALSWDGATSNWSQGHAVLVAARPVLLWSLVLVTIFLLGKDVQSYAIALPTVSQADAAVGIENAIPGVSQGKTWGAAALITVAILACGVALVAVVDAVANAYGYGITTLFTALNLSVFGAVIGIVDRYVPIVAMCQLAIFRWGAPYILTPIYLAASSLIKFLKA